MRWLLYNILFTLGFLLLLPKHLLRMRRRGGYRKDFGQRLARYRDEVITLLGAEPRPIWIHAVSVGEIFVAFPLMEALRYRDPSLRFVLSVTTSTAHAIAEKRLQAPDALIYFPVDFPPVVRRALKRLRPRALVLVEAEYWPNLLRQAAAGGIPVSLVNGRLSDSSYRGYLKLIGFTKAILPTLAPVCVQGELDRQRLEELGVRPEVLHVMGSAKYGVSEPSPDHVAKLHGVFHAAGFGEETLVLLGGSTWDGEEQVLVELYRRLKSDIPELVLVLVPRHVERSAEVITVVEQAGLRMSLRSEVQEEAPAESAPDVLLVDSTGELAALYACADLVFVGKSLTQHGGQNPIEPAVCGKPVVVGPHMENFPVVMGDFLAAEALRQVGDKAELERTVRELLGSEEERLALGDRAAQLVARQRGALPATADLLLERWGTER